MHHHQTTKGGEHRCCGGHHKGHHGEHGQSRHSEHHHHGEHHEQRCHGKHHHHAAGMGGDGHHCRRHGMGGHDDRFDRHGFGGGRRLSSADLQLIVLALLEQKPRHGYELIKALETQTHGFYVPSPGMVYPILTYLEESDQATVSASGNKKLYTITETGLATLNENREQVETMLGRLEQAGQHLQKMQQMYAEETATPAEGDAFHEAVHALREVLRSKRFASAEEKQRITTILQQVLKEI